jgi:hypothetical protein
MDDQQPWLSLDEVGEKYPLLRELTSRIMLGYRVSTLDQTVPFEEYFRDNEPHAGITRKFALLSASGEVKVDLEELEWFMTRLRRDFKDGILPDDVVVCSLSDRRHFGTLFRAHLIICERTSEWNRSGLLTA